MKEKISCVLIALLLSINLFAQEKTLSTLPSVNVKKLDGSTFNTDGIANDGKPIIVSFWATWCKPCVNELNTIAENYKEWQKETGVKLIAVSVDDSRTSSTVSPFVNGKNWEYEVLLDPSGDFKRAMNVNMVPHTFLLNGKKEIVDQHTSFAPGDEDILLEKIKKTAAGQPVSK